MSKIHKRIGKTKTSYEIFWYEPVIDTGNTPRLIIKRFNTEQEAKERLVMVKEAKEQGVYYQRFNNKGHPYSIKNSTEEALIKYFNEVIDPLNLYFLKTKTSLYNCPSYIYIFQELRINGKGRIKIGVTTNPTKRYSGFKTYFPFGLKVLVLSPGNKKTEKQIHEQFSHFKLVGEWFIPEQTIIKYCENINDLNPIIISKELLNAQT